MKRWTVVSGWNCAWLMGFLMAGPLATAAPIVKKLEVKPINQEQSKWCWAACAEMVIQYVKPTLDAKQCELVKLEMGTSANCCNPAASSFESACNQTGFPEECFDHHGIDYKPSETRLSWTRLTKQIDEGNPMLYAWFWNNSFQSGHMVVLYGYGLVQGEKVLFRYDPIPQVGTDPYILFFDHYKTQIHNETWYGIKKTDN